MGENLPQVIRGEDKKLFETTYCSYDIPLHTCLVQPWDPYNGSL